MAVQVQSHPTTIEADAPAQVAVGDGFVVKLTVTCPQGCDLHGLPVTIAAPDGAAATGELAAGGDAGNAAAIALKAPRSVGDHVYKVVLPQHEHGGVRHEESTGSVTVRTEPLATSLAVWDIPSPVVTGERFAIKVGAKSASGCALTGKAIEICDATGAVLARGAFGDAPFEGTSALYWAAVELRAPPDAGVVSWSVRFTAAQLELPHESSASQFSVAVVPSPEHRLTVKVVDKETAAAIEDVQVLVGAYRAATDQAGRADVRLPKGTYDLGIWKVGYEAPAQSVVVDADLDIKVEAVVVPEEDPDAAWTA